MSPEQIEVVRHRWALALRDRQRLEAAVADGLTGSAPTRASRARWTVGSVTQLALVLDRPTAFASLAQAEIDRRTPVTLDELARERNALLGALRDLGGEFAPAEERAWALAFGCSRRWSRPSGSTRSTPETSRTCRRTPSAAHLDHCARASPEPPTGPGRPAPPTTRRDLP